MKSTTQIAACLFATTCTVLGDNIAPTVVVLGAEQRPGTTFMDIDYRIDDPDDATVETGVLGFVNGGTSLSDIVKVNTLVEGTDVNIGSNILANAVHHLTWNVAADWNTNFGNVQIEILAQDGRELLPFHWITLPSNGPNPQITINKWPLYDSDLLALWYWLLARNDPAIRLVNGAVYGTTGEYDIPFPLTEEVSTTTLGREFLWERLDVRPLSGSELTRANTGRYGFQLLNAYCVARGFVTPDRLYSWGMNTSGQGDLPAPLISITAVAVGDIHTIALTGGAVVGWGANDEGQTTIPASATNVVALAVWACNAGVTA